MIKILIFLILCLAFVPPVLAKETVIRMEDAGFNPAEVTINKDETIIFQNAGTKDYWPASDIHPTHGIYPEFDPKKPIKSGESWQFKFDKAGTWSMHDHLNPFSTGKITVTGQNTPQKISWLEKLQTNFKSFWLTIYYKIYPKAGEEMLKGLNLQTFEIDDPEVKEALRLLGREKIRDKLVADSASGSKFDCHQQAHKLGRMSYEVFGVNAFQGMDTTCHSGLIHGAMEAFLKEKGTQNLSADIKKLCDSADTDFGHFECLHGVGHGVMAYSAYDMPKALSACKNLADSFSTSSCFGGVFMENIIVSEGNGVIAAHDTKWVSKDPYFPCSGVDQQDETLQVQCWMMQTARMLDMNNYDFKIVADLCSKAPEERRWVCFQSMGRDGAGQTLRNAYKTDQICRMAPDKYYQDCLRGALYVFIEFWGSNMTSQPHEFCKALDEKDKAYCYSLLGGRLPGIFKTEQKIREICQFSEKNYVNTCLQSSGLN